MLASNTTAQSTNFRCRFFKLKFALLLILVFSFEFQDEKQNQQQLFERDLQYCAACFQYQTENCTKFLEAVIADQAPSKLEILLNILALPTKRLLHFWRLNTTKIISKSVTEIQLKSFQNINKTAANLKTIFIESENLEGLQLCPRRDSQRLFKYLQQQTPHTDIAIWLHLLLDVEPLLMPLLAINDFPVPSTYATCGFTMFQAYVGKALPYYYHHEDFLLKLKIAKALLVAVLRFSKGFDGFRIYITDLNADNLIWNEAEERLYFVDLDSIIILDSKEAQLQRETHKHSYIECDGCFAYSQQEICDHQLSDINIFAACQLLREDLSRKREAGFLYPIPIEILKKYPQFNKLLDECFDCVDTTCRDRFSVAQQLLELFGNILNNEF